MSCRPLLSLVLLALFCPALVATELAAAPAKVTIEKRFADWLHGPLWQRAKHQGISRAAFDAAVRNVRLNWSLPDLDPTVTGQKPPANRQSEFRAPGNYFKPSHIAYNVSKGREQLKKWRKTLAAIERRYGVPGEIVLSIWGKETAFGSAALPYNAIEVLATQAFIGRRKALFETELLAALRILAGGHIAPNQMNSAWAGALGHPQFMPTAFLKYAVDFDGDGRKNIWTSVPDSLASIAHFLQQHGWRRNAGWGLEVMAPSRLSCILEGPERRSPLSDWQKRGVKRADGRPFAPHQLDWPVSLLMPAGRFGPAFLVTANFYVLKDYNESDVYALLVGHVADRIKADPGFTSRWQELESFSREDVQAAQQRLEKRGHDVGGADGLIGYKTRIAIGQWQQKTGQTPTYFPDRRTLKAIR